MAFKDLNDFFDPTLRLPIRGKTYVVQSPDAKTGLWCQQLFATASVSVAGVEVNQADLARLELDDGEEFELYARVLGDAMEQMTEDKVPWEYLKHAGVTAFIWVAGDRDAAERFWEAAHPGEADRPKPQDRKAPAKKKSAARPASRDGSKSRKRPATTTPSRES